VQPDLLDLIPLDIRSHGRIGDGDRVGVEYYFRRHAQGTEDTDHADDNRNEDPIPVAKLSYYSCKKHMIARTITLMISIPDDKKALYNILCMGRTSSFYPYHKML
jgi:hypothetical protein